MFKINNEFSKANQQKTVRFPAKLLNELEEISVKKNVSFNMLILQCCRYALDNMEEDEE